MSAERPTGSQLEEEAQSQPPERPTLDGQDMSVQVFDAVRDGSGNPVQPVRLQAGDNFDFRCHRGVACWNRCCHGADVTLTPNDILRLSRHFGMRPAEFLLAHTVPAIHESSALPVAKLKMGDGKEAGDGKGPCPFVAAEGCTVYENRPATCRYYPLGMVSMKMKDSDRKEDFFFLVKEAHCRGHEEKREQNVAQFRAEQGIEDYDRVNRGWIDILMKMASWKSLGGPGGKDIQPATKKMFFMATTDVDSFRRFVFGTKFLETYEVDPEAVKIVETDDEALLLLAFDWLKNVLFNEPTILMKETVLKAAIGRARENVGGT